jgi:hypothetical protein
MVVEKQSGHGTAAYLLEIGEMVSGNTNIGWQ